MRRWGRSLSPLEPAANRAGRPCSLWGSGGRQEEGGGQLITMLVSRRSLASGRGASPFHMRRHTPLDRCNSVTRPKSSVTAASELQGDNTMDSPWRRESGSPNLEASWGLECSWERLGAEVTQVTQNYLGGMRAGCCLPDSEGRCRLHLRLLLLHRLLLRPGFVPSQPTTE